MAGLRFEQFHPGQGILAFEHVPLDQRDEIVCRTVRNAPMPAKPA